MSAPAANVDHCQETGRVRGVLCFSSRPRWGSSGPARCHQAGCRYVEGIAWKPTLVTPGVCQLPS
ncbi:endonuclease domain-containing protein [Streptomyces thermocarboxydovorans]|uniref:endonuclease domain-containing protein n=1 Tax=Streptomyces thermocarboxydovorans TaxID=59298 RepID=UPI0031D33E15